MTYPSEHGAYIACKTAVPRLSIKHLAPPTLTLQELDQLIS